MKNAIKAYFEELIQNDNAMKEVYSESKLDGCIKYITDMARKELKGASGAIKDEIVFKWARDFMLGDVENAESSNAPTIEPATTEPKEEIKGTVIEDGIIEIVPDLVTKQIQEEKEKNCGACGYDYQDECQNNESTPVEPSTPACSDFIQRVTVEDAKPTQSKLVIEKVEDQQEAKTKKKEKTTDLNQLCFDFGD